VFTEVAVGEGMVSLLDEHGRPSVVERAWVVPPASRIGPLGAEERQKIVQSSPVAGHYEKTLDRESAYEQLKGRAATNAPADAPPRPPAPAGGGGGIGDVLFGTTGPRGGYHPGVLDTVAKSAARSIGSSVGREIIRGVLGSILGGGRRR
jgi:DNA helicase HerA-like ATPase